MASIPLFPSTPPTTNSAQLQLPNISSTTNTTNNTTTLGHNLLQPPPAHQNTTTQSSVNNITLGYNPPPSHALMRSLNTPGLPGHWQNFRNLIVSHTQQPPSQQALVQQLQTPGSNLPVLGMSNSGSSLLSGINPLGMCTETCIISCQDYEMHPVCTCTCQRVCVCPLVCHTDFLKSTAFTPFFFFFFVNFLSQ